MYSLQTFIFLNMNFQCSFTSVFYYFYLCRTYAPGDISPSILVVTWFRTQHVTSTILPIFHVIEEYVAEDAVLKSYRFKIEMRQPEKSLLVFGWYNSHGFAEPLLMFFAFSNRSEFTLVTMLPFKPPFQHNNLTLEHSRIRCLIDATRI